MQQRRLRLGDILDDYCPRERRITNHVVVAMIDDDVKQTRCSTCDADHEYKQGKTPAARRRKPDSVLAGEVEAALRPRTAVDDVDADVDVEEDEQEQEDESQVAAGESSEVPMAAEGGDQDADEEGDPDADLDDDAGNRAGDDDGPVHRRLIRATLPRQEGQVPERKATDFTVRQPGGRGGGGRGEFDGNKPSYRPSGSGGPGGPGGPGGRGPRRPMRAQGGPPGGQPSRFGGGGPRQGPGQGPRPPGNRPPGPGGGANRGGARPPGQGRGPGGGGGRKRGPR